MPGLRVLRPAGRRAARAPFPSGPVSADAVLLTSLGVESGHDAEGLSRHLIASVVGDLVRRGVRALEAFGRTAEVDRVCWTLDWCRQSCGPSSRCSGTARSTSACWTPICLQDAGFVVVTHHRYFPRLRLELEQGLGWKADVEAALERLLETAQLQQPVGAGVEPLLSADPVRSG